MASRSSDNVWSRVQLATKDSDTDRITSILNQAYKIGEHGIIEDSPERPFERATRQNVSEWAAKNMLLVVLSKENNELGCIKVETYSIEDSNDPADGQLCGTWGCLAVEQSYQGKGLGRRLVHAAEEFLVKQGCQVIQLELLAPSHWKHTHKERLRTWYTERLGYTYEASTTSMKKGTLLAGTFRLATDSAFTNYRKFPRLENFPPSSQRHE